MPTGRPGTPTKKHNMRIPDDVWETAGLKAARLAALGYKGENGKYSVTDLCRDNLRQAADEPDERTVLRLGLGKGETAQVTT